MHKSRWDFIQHLDRLKTKLKHIIYTKKQEQLTSNFIFWLLPDIFSIPLYKISCYNLLNGRDGSKIFPYTPSTNSCVNCWNGHLTKINIISFINCQHKKSKLISMGQISTRTISMNNLRVQIFQRVYKKN